MSQRYVVVVKADCPTCQLIAPVLEALAPRETVALWTQDDPAFPAVPGVQHDVTLKASFDLGVEIVPALIAFSGQEEVARCEGWERAAWQSILEDPTLGAELPALRPGCASLSVTPPHSERLRAERLAARRVTLGQEEDIQEALFDRGWSDGLPVVPPTPERVARMLEGTSRDPAEVLGDVPPNLVPVTVEKVAINAVLAGCKPEYLPVVLAAVEAALLPPFCMHGLLATTYFSGPMVVVCGPLAKAIGMNSQGNALGQGNRANATIGRALQLVIRNVGGGRPQGVDRATLGNPGKYTFCFAEDGDPKWSNLNEDAGLARNANSVTLFAADGVQGIVDQKARTPEPLCRSFAEALKVVSHPKMVQAADAFLVVSPEHARVFHDAGWSKEAVIKTLRDYLTRPGQELVRGAGGMEEGLPPALAERSFEKFRDGGLRLVRAGGEAGMFSAVIGGWGASGTIGSSPVTHEIRL
jgi:hypothetical protein